MGPRDGGVVGDGAEEPERSDGAFVGGGEGMRRSEEAKVSEEAVKCVRCLACGCSRCQSQPFRGGA